MGDIFNLPVGLAIQNYQNEIFKAASAFKTFLRGNNVSALNNYVDVMIMAYQKALSTKTSEKLEIIDQIISVTYCAEVKVKSLGSANFISRKASVKILSSLAEIRKTCTQWKRNFKDKWPLRLSTISIESSIREKA